MRFAHPEWLMLLWFLPVIVGLAVFFSRRARSRLEAGLGSRMTPLLSRQVSPSRRRWRLLFRCLALVFATVALARPQLGKGLAEIKVRGVEMMVAFDVSTSMLAEDIKPSRLQFAKSELVRLFDRLAGDKVGLVGFAGSAVLLSPLTTDISSLKMFLDSLTPNSVETQGTDFTRALQEAADAFDRGGIEDDDRVKTTRVILVLSDGEDQEKGALELAKKLANQGVRIFTMAFGTDRGGLIPVRDDRGYLRGYKKDRDGREVISKVKGDFLRELARVGQGAFHFATFGGGEAQLVKNDLDRLQKAEFASSMATQYEERFQWFLILALVFFALDLLLSDRAAVERVWRGRFEAGLRVLAPISLGLALGAAPAEASEFRGIRNNNKAVDSFYAERPSEALNEFTRSLGDLPDRPELHFNIARSYHESKDVAKAVSEYDVALKLQAKAPPNPELEFKLHFNRAMALAADKKTDAALASFQEALRLQPDSTEVKTNIELMMASGQGGGDGESKDNQDSKDQGQDQKNQKPKDGKDQKQNQNQNQNQPKGKPTPKPFASDQLSQQDVNRILEELKRQEDQIRERMQRQGAPDTAKDKDW